MYLLSLQVLTQLYIELSSFLGSAIRYATLHYRFRLDLLGNTYPIPRPRLHLYFNVLLPWKPPDAQLRIVQPHQWDFTSDATDIAYN